MVFNTTFNNISVILWRSVLLVEETGVPGSLTNFYHIILYLVHLAMKGVGTRNFRVVIGTDCTCSCKSNYHMITTAPYFYIESKKVGLNLKKTDDFFQLFNWFQLFSFEKKFESYRTWSEEVKNGGFERGCRWFQLF